MKRGIKYGIPLRVAVDGVILAASLLAAFLLRYIYAVASGEYRGGGYGVLLKYNYLTHYAECLIVLIPLGLGSFAFFGLYSQARAYSLRSKALTVVYAVCVPYLLLPLLAFILEDVIPLPRSVLLIGWGITLAVELLARTWSSVWRNLLLHEDAKHMRHYHDERKILLIGGAGYIGSALLPKLLDAGYHVRLLDMFLYTKEPIQAHLRHPNLELVEGDFRQVEKVVSAMRGVGSVIHLGGLVGDPACAVDEQLTIEINLVATRVIAQVAKGEGVHRFVFASTCSVYGASDDLLDEESDLNPVSLYARSKIASERVLLEAADHTFAPIILRFGTIFGLSGRTRFDLVVNLLTAKAVFEKKITVFGGDQWRPFVHVDDAALGILTVLQAPIQKVDSEIFNIGGDSMNYTLGQVGELIKKMVPDAELIDSGANADRRNYRVDFGKVRRALGFEPKWKLDEGITQVLQAIRSGQVTDYKLSIYSNVKSLQDEKIRVLEKESGWERRILDGVGPSEQSMT